MKKLIDITDEDVIKVIDQIHRLTENKVIGRFGILGLSFEDSYRKYGNCYIKIELLSEDRVTDGYFTTYSYCHIKFHHESVWFEEYTSDGESSTYNKNHYFGYKKLIELGYDFPIEPQWI